MADALWQAQDDRHDAGGVFVIPGPRSVAGIERADEPVARAAGALRGGGDRARARRRRGAVAARAPRRPRTRAGAARGRDRGPRRAGRRAVRRAVAARRRAGGRATRGRTRCGDSSSRATRSARCSTTPGDSSASRCGRRAARANGWRSRRTATRPSSPSRCRRSTGRRPSSSRAGAPAGSGSFVAVDGDAGTVAFARRVLGADAALVPEHPLDEVQAAWSCPDGLAGAHGAATGAAHDGAGVDLALTLAWPAVAGLLSSTPFAARLAQLVHAGHRVVPGAAWPPRPGEHGQVRARVVLLDDAESAPTRLTCRALLRCERGELATVDVELVTLGASPVTDRLRHERTAHRVELALERGGGGVAGGARVAARCGPAGRRSRDDRGRVRHRSARAAARRRGAPAGACCATGEHAGTIDWTRAAARIRRRSDCASGRTRAGGTARPPRRRRATTRRREQRRVVARDVAPGLDGCLRARRAATTTRCIAASSRRASAACRARSCTARGPPRARRRSSSRRCARAIAGALRDWRIDFVAPVALGAALELEATLTGVDRGLRVVEVTVSVGDEIVARGEALVAQPPTVLVFTGQGVQRTRPRRGRPRPLAGGARRLGTRRCAHARAARLLAARRRRAQPDRAAARRRCGAAPSRRRPAPHRAHAARARDARRRAARGAARAGRARRGARARRRPQRRRVRGARRARRARARGRDRARLPARRAHAGLRRARRRRALAVRHGGGGSVARRR